MAQPVGGDDLGRQDVTRPDKLVLRRQLLQRRRAMGDGARERAEVAIARHLFGTEELAGATTVAAYVGVGREPGTLRLLEALLGLDKRVLLPILRPDSDLDWGEFRGEHTLVGAGLGLREPPGPRLGVQAVSDADVVLCPGLGVAADGMRLGRGGGSYDRVLARLPRDEEGRTRAWTCVLVYDHEVVDRVPAEPHDRPVRAAATPGGVIRF